MAEIQDGAFGYISGTVGKVFETKNGQAFEIEVQGKGQYPDRWTVWSALNVAQGDRVTVKGHLSARLGTYGARTGETKHKVDRAVNGAELVAHEPVPGDTFGHANGWATANAGFPSDDSTPF